MLLVVCLGWFFFIRPLFYDRVYQGVKINSINVGGLSEQELIKVVDELAVSYHSNNIILYYKDFEYKITGDMLEVAIDKAQIISTIWNYGRQGNCLQRIITILETKKNSYIITPYIKYNEDKLIKTIADLKLKIEKKHVMQN